jgi:hypothetical protein
MEISTSTFGPFGGSPPTSFVDPLSNASGSIAGPLNLATVNTFNWFFSFLGWDTPFATPADFITFFSFGQTLSGGGGTGLTVSGQAFGAGTYNWFCGIIPTRMAPGLGPFTSPYYASKTKFVQFTFNAINANCAGGVGIINFEDLSGTGVAGSSNICHDAYILRCDGNMIRHNSGAANSVLQGGIVFTQGDVWRMSMDATAASPTVIRLTKNGTLFATINDNNVNRLQGPGMPFIGAVMVGPGPQFEIKNFSCGVGL